MNTLTYISALLLLGTVQGQFGGLWNGGAFNPWNNPNHPANRGIANGIAARNFFAWPAAPFIRAGPIPSMIPDGPAVNIDEVPEDRREALDELAERKEELDSKIREAATGGGSIASNFRPGFVNDLLRERMQVVNDIRRTQQEAVRDRLALVAKRQEIAKQIAESTEPITFGLLMRSLNRAYGQEMAAKSIAHQRKILRKFDRPFLRPVISVFAPNGLPTGAVAETKIYQNFKEQKGTLLKDEDIFIVTKLSGFSGDKLHLGVDLHAVNETSSDTQALSEDFLETELEFQDEMLESQMTLSQRWLELQLGNPEEQTELQEKIMKKQLNRAEKILELKNKLAERQRDLEQKLVEKQQDLIERELERQQKLVEKQQDLYEKQLEKHRKELEKQAEAEAKALERQLDFSGRFSDNGFVQQQLEFARQQALINNPSQQHIESGLEFLRNKIRSLPGGGDSILQKRLEDEAKLEEKQRELEQKLLEKQRDLLEKQAEKERDLLQKKLEKEQDLREKLVEQEAKAAEKLKDKLEKERELAQKELERQQDLAEKDAELLEKLQEKKAEKAAKKQEKELDLLEKQLEKEQKSAEKEGERLQKQLEKEQDQLEKEQEKAEKSLEKEREKAQKQLEKEQEKALKQLEKDQKLMEKQLEKELKQLEKENDLVEKQAELVQEQQIDSLPIFDTIPRVPFAHQQFNPFVPRFGPPNGFRF